MTCEMFVRRVFLESIIYIKDQTPEELENHCCTAVYRVLACHVIPKVRFNPQLIKELPWCFRSLLEHTAPSVKWIS